MKPTITFNPTTNNSFTYTISDGHGGTATVNVDIEVTSTCQGIPCSD